jgi:hypothetical protein
MIHFLPSHLRFPSHYESLQLTSLSHVCHMTAEAGSGGSINHLSCAQAVFGGSCSWCSNSIVHIRRCSTVKSFQSYYLSVQELKYTLSFPSVWSTVSAEVVPFRVLNFSCLCPQNISTSSQSLILPVHPINPKGDGILASQVSFTPQLWVAYEL